jgi:hypothetical protein
MVALNKDYLAKYNIDANQLAGIIPFSGHAITHFTIRKEKGFPEYKPLIDEFAPIYFVRADAPPMLLITGDRELEFSADTKKMPYMLRMMKWQGINKLLYMNCKVSTTEEWQNQLFRCF